MGYDMYYRDRADHDDGGYFRLNVWGMSWCSEIMARRGMVFDAGRYPPFPDCPDDFEVYARRYPEDYRTRS